MKILLVSNIPASRYTGMGRWSWAIAESLRLDGFTVDEWYNREVSVSARWHRIRVFGVPIKIAYKVWRVRRHYDAVLIHEPLAWPAAMLSNLFPRAMPFIFAVSHGIESRGAQEFEQARKLGFFERDVISRLKIRFFHTWQSNLGLRLAAKVICLNSKDALYLQDVLGRLPKDIVQINNGIDPATELPMLGNTVRDPNAIIVLGQWLDYKGRRILPQLWHRVHNICPNAHLTLIGTIADEDTVRSAFAPELQTSITVVPKLHDRADLLAILLSASVFLMPSIGEGSPLAMVEAMASGLAPVGSNAGGIPDLLDNGRAGHLFDWRSPQAGADKVIELLVNPAGCLELGKKARNRAEMLTWKKAAEPIADSLKSLQTRAN